MEKWEYIKNKAASAKETTKILTGSSLVAGGTVLEFTSKSVEPRTTGVFLIAAGISLNYLTARQFEKKKKMMEEQIRICERKERGAIYQRNVIVDIYRNQRKLPRHPEK